MTDTNRQKVIDYLVTKLGSISTGNGYRSTVAHCEFHVKTWSEAAKLARPSIGVAITKERYTYSSSSLLTVEASFSVVQHVDADSGAEKSEVLSDMIDDVIKALHDDVTCGGVAEKLMLVDGMTDEPDPTKRTLPIGTSMINFVVTFERTTEGTP